MTRKGNNESDDTSGEFPDDWADGDTDAAPAPISAYERPWRHPSELGPLVHHIETATYPGRNLLAASAVIGLAFAVVLVRLVTAEGTGRSASLQSTTAVRAQQVSLSSEISHGTTAATAPVPTIDHGVAAETAGVFVTEAITTTTVAAASVTTRVKNAASSAAQSVAQRLRRSGVAVNDGSEVITTSKGLSNHAHLDVVLPLGEKRTGEVVEIHPESGVALVALDSPTDAPTVAPVDSNESEYTVDVNGQEKPCTLSLRSDGMVVTLDDAADKPTGTDIDNDAGKIPEGSAIMTSDGAVVGLTTWTTGSAHVVQLATVIGSFHSDRTESPATSGIRSNPSDPGADSTSTPSPATLSMPTSPASSQPATTPSSQQLASTTMVTRRSVPSPVGSSTAPTAGWFGILGGDTVDGVKITAVVVGSPAQSAGLLPDDLIVSYANKPISSIDQLAKLVHAGQAGAVIDIGYRVPGSTAVVHAVVTLAIAA